jgi:predicted lipoprotein with Yx(FWY)xxD motif
MRKVFLAAIAMSTVVLGGAWMAGGADAPSPLKVMKAGDLGEVLTGPSGMTLYTFANDKQAGKSVCNGQCAENWPPLQPAVSAPAPTAPLSIITRDDGTKQYAYKDKPLYYWKNDKKPGETTGHKVRDVWFVAQP